MTTTTRKRDYYTLLAREPGQPWTIEFGDYVRSVVEQERTDQRASFGWPKGTEFKIIRTDERAEFIYAKVAELNGVTTTQGQLPTEGRRPQC